MYLEKGQIDTYLIEAKGIIRLGLLQRYLKYLKKLDRASDGKFNHVVDTSQVRFANPLNPFYLKSISRLEHLNLYIVIVPSGFLRLLVNLTKWINKPDYVIKSMRNFDVIS